MSASAPTLLTLSASGGAATTVNPRVVMPFSCRVASLSVTAGIAPTGATLLNGTVTKTTGAAAAVVIGTWSFAASAKAATVTMSSTDGANEVTKDDVVALVIAAVGNTIAGSDLTALLELDQAADQDGVNVHSISVLRGNHPGSVVA